MGMEYEILIMKYLSVLCPTLLYIIFYTIVLYVAMLCYAMLCDAVYFGYTSAFDLLRTSVATAVLPEATRHTHAPSMIQPLQIH